MNQTATIFDLIASSRGGLSSSQIIDGLAERDFYPTEPGLRAILSQQKKAGRISHSEHDRCPCCKKRNAVYGLTEAGRRYLAEKKVSP